MKEKNKKDELGKDIVGSLLNGILDGISKEKSCGVSNEEEDVGDFDYNPVYVPSGNQNIKTLLVFNVNVGNQTCHKAKWCCMKTKESMMPLLKKLPKTYGVIFSICRDDSFAFVELLNLGE